MFENVKEFIEKLEMIKSKNSGELTINDKVFLNHVDLYLAGAIMLDWGDSVTVANIILATKNKS